MALAILKAEQSPAELAQVVADNQSRHGRQRAEREHAPKRAELLKVSPTGRYRSRDMGSFAEGFEHSTT